MRFQAEAGISDICFHITKNAHCSMCDADVATGVNKERYMCESLCEEWYEACSDSWYDTGANWNRKIPFCVRNSKDCTTVAEFIPSPEKWCKVMGF